uniref:AF4/FMR2 family member 3 n=1 Tax=Rhabditophanes sp. KR3021 TaxID=114890 RepID=A0AC35U384_9BILA
MESFSFDDGGSSLSPLTGETLKDPLFNESIQVDEESGRISMKSPVPPKAEYYKQIRHSIDMSLHLPNNAELVSSEESEADTRKSSIIERIHKFHNQITKHMQVGMQKKQNQSNLLNNTSGGELGAAFSSAATVTESYPRLVSNFNKKPQNNSNQFRSVTKNAKPASSYYRNNKYSDEVSSLSSVHSSISEQDKTNEHKARELIRQWEEDEVKSYGSITSGISEKDRKHLDDKLKYYRSKNKSARSDSSVSSSSSSSKSSQPSACTSSTLKSSQSSSSGSTSSTLKSSTSITTTSESSSSEATTTSSSASGSTSNSSLSELSTPGSENSSSSTLTSQSVNKKKKQKKNKIEIALSSSSESENVLVDSEPHVPKKLQFSDEEREQKETKTQNVEKEQKSGGLLALPEHLSRAYSTIFNPPSKKKKHLNVYKETVNEYVDYIADFINSDSTTVAEMQNRMYEISDRALLARAIANMKLYEKELVQQ